MKRIFDPTRPAFFRRLLAGTLLCPLLLGAAEFNRSALLTTVARVVDVDGENYAYVLWQPGDALSTIGNHYGV